MSANPEPLMTVNDVATLAGMTPNALRKRAERGAVPGMVRLSARTIRFKAEAIRRWLQGVPAVPDRAVEVSAPNAPTLRGGKSRASA